MIDLAHIETLVGPLPVVRWWQREYTAPKPLESDTSTEDLANGAVDELLTALKRLIANIEEVTAFVLPGGYDEKVAEKILSDPVTHAFAFVADREHERAEKAEAKLKYRELDREGYMARIQQAETELRALRETYHELTGKAWDWGPDYLARHDAERRGGA